MSIMNTFCMQYTPRIFILACIALISLPASFIQAETLDVSVIPVVIDEKAKVRDIVKQSITLSNRTNHKLNLYPSVNDINPDEGTQDFVSAQDSRERMDSLSQWVELSRGVVELGPGEVKTIPFVIRVTANALPGVYHANVSFSNGGTREEAEGAGAVVTVMVNLEVQADVKEILQLNKFSTDSIFFSGDDVLFNYQLENIGNQVLKPKGEIRIYNRKGEEVASIDVNKDGKGVTPDQVSQMASVWSAASGFGKYKAFLTVDYGSSQTASVQDTVFFWIVPWQQLLALFVVSIAGLIFLGFRYEQWFHERHLARVDPVGARLAQEAKQAIPQVVAPVYDSPSRIEKVVATLSSFVPATRTRPTPLDIEAVPEEKIVPKSLKSQIALPEEKIERPVSTTGGHTIDLKTMKPMSAPPREVHSENHVINLKS